MPTNGQNSTTSPYSMFGIGVIENNSDVVNSGMGYTGIALPSKGYLNNLNPASFSSLDSSTFTFNIQAEASFAKYATEYESKKTINGNIDGLSFGFKVNDNWGMSIGLSPYSSIGYHINSEKYIIGSESTYPVNYEGSGGLSKLYWSNGIRLFKQFSFGINLAYLWGTTDLSETSSYPYILGETIINQKSYKINNLYLEYGFQYQLPIKSNLLSFGGTINTESSLYTSYVHRIYTSADYEYYSKQKEAEDILIPQSFSLGASFESKNGWLVAADYHFGKWSSLDMTSVNGHFKDINRYNFGIQYEPQSKSKRSLLQKLSYRFGGFYAENYLDINGIDLSEKGVTMGFSLPINRNSLLNFSYEHKQSGSQLQGLIKESYNTFKLGITFNERWFVRHQFE
jgi:hypothetical protein